MIPDFNVKDLFWNIYAFVLIVLLWLIAGCEGKQWTTQQKISIPRSTESDTIIGSQAITHELAGSAYRKRATAYFVIINKDTSEFRPVFTESKDGNAIAIDLQLPDSAKAITYRQMLSELQLILTEAAKEYNFGELRGLSLGRLVRTGDLAVEVSRQYTKTFGTNKIIQTGDYGKVSQFLLQTPLTTDLHHLFGPYGLSVSQVSIEKVFFTSREDLKYGLTLETDTTQIPHKILDCLTWVRFKLD